MSSVITKAAEVKKTLVATTGFLAELLATGVLHGTAEHVVQGVLGVATIFGVYQARNDTSAADSVGY